MLKNISSKPQIGPKKPKYYKILKKNIMTRYREPPKKAAPYITPAGHKALVEELQDLWKKKRPEVTRKVAEAAAMGDRSENADYIYGKKQLREIDRRIQYLSKRLDVLIVVDRLPEHQDKVFFGAWVSLLSSQNQESFRLVGPDEFDRESEYISIDSPMAKALLGKTVGTKVVVNDTRWELIEISYKKKLGSKL